MTPSPLVVFGFGLLTIVLAGLFLFAVARSGHKVGRVALGVAIWLAATFGLAAVGAFAFGPMPPRVPIVFAVTLGLTIWVARSSIGHALAGAFPFSILVGFHAFRILVEILLHRAAADGLAPPQMTWSGLNFDIVTGVLAIPVAWLAHKGRASPKLIGAWNVLGALLLANVLVIAILSMPLPIRVFMNEPANTWVSQPPFIWLPTFIVPCAILGHLLLWWKLRAERHSSQRSPVSTFVTLDKTCH